MPDLKTALSAAHKAQEDLDALIETTDLVAEKRDKAVLAAKEAKATHAQVQEATGLSISRITQIIRRARENASAGQQ